MGRLTVQKKDHFGREFNTYIYNGFRVEIMPYFLYEVCINKYWKNGFCVLGSKFLKTEDLLYIHRTNIFKYYKDYIIEKEISLIGVPYKFIRENNLPVYKPNIKNKKLKKDERTR